MRSTILLLVLAFFAVTLPAQVSDSGQSEKLAIDYLNRHLRLWGFEEDSPQMRLSSTYTSDHNGVTHVYMHQQYNGADIEKATYNVNIRDGEVVMAFQKLIPGFSQYVSSTTVSVTPESATGTALSHFGQELRAPLKVKSRQGANRYIIDRTGVSRSDIHASLTWIRLRGNQFTLTWKISVEPISDNDLHSVFVDAASGEVLRVKNLSVYCTFPHTHTESCGDDEIPNQELALPSEPVSGDGAEYMVIPIPFESPRHISRRLIVDPSDPDASPYGWHDMNGSPGAEATTTIGNNVHAFVDRDGDFYENEIIVDGGSSLSFIFPLNEANEPDMYQPATVTNLFYLNNIMHDFSYHYGFNEEAGNFQEYNYTGEGNDGDNVRAHAQFGAGNENPPTNNAVFTTPIDGGNGRMRMYIWDVDNQLLVVEEPEVIEGIYSTSTTADDWAVPITTEPVTGEVVLVEDVTGAPSLGCYSLINGDELDGKIAMIDRGQCDFSLKALNAQEAGAIGFIICNYEEGLVTMGGGDGAGEVNIPGVFMSSSSCQTLKAFLNSGLVVSLVNASDTLGPHLLSGSFDNGIIAHEYGHGISNRLTHGPMYTECLQNYDNDPTSEGADDGEQMGEGWSDFFSLVLTAKATDLPTRERGIATYAEKQDTSGLGIRSYPYTVDMNVNPLTYDDITSASLPHGIGAVWCSMLWDMYWALVEEYGFDPDLYRGNGGNNLAIQLVIDGMKIQPCQPTFVEARDAILAADKILTGGENQLLLWEVFARRGLGYSAVSGADSLRNDGNEAFDVKPDEIHSIKLYKEMSAWADGGDFIDVTITVHNHKGEAATDVVISDVIPEGTTAVPGSGSVAFEQVGDMVVFELGEIAPEDSLMISYQLLTPSDRLSSRMFFDDAENGILNWGVLNQGGNDAWQIEQQDVFNGSKAFKVKSGTVAVDASLFNIETFVITGDHPVLYFQHKYESEPFYDAGTMLISNDNGFSWQPVTEEMIIRSGYTGKLPYGLFGVPGLRGWHGSHTEWQGAVIDLSDYLGEEIRVRFRFGANDRIPSNGWVIDDIELMDAIHYNSEVCLTSTEGDDICTTAKEGGTYIFSGTVSSTSAGPDATGEIRVYPNPATTSLTVEISDERTGKASVILYDVKGSTIKDAMQIPAGTTKHVIDISGILPGIYFLKVSRVGMTEVVKVVIE